MVNGFPYQSLTTGNIGNLGVRGEFGISYLPASSATE
jgi:hypothetical protein